MMEVVLHLEQGNDSVAQYAAKLIDLSPFIVADEPSKIQHFVHGLRRNLQRQVIGHRLASFDEAVEKATQIESFDRDVRIWEAFLHLKQGNDSVAQYAAKFTELSRHVSLIAVERRIILHFVCGLRRNLQRQVIGHLPSSFNEAAKIARLIESVDRDSGKQAVVQSDNIRRLPQYGKKRKSSPYQFQNSSSMLGQSSAGHTSISNRRLIVCYSCNQPGHTVRQCPQHQQSGEQLCYTCKQTGHMARECPQQGDTSNVARPSQSPRPTPIPSYGRNSPQISRAFTTPGNVQQGSRQTKGRGRPSQMTHGRVYMMTPQLEEPTEDTVMEAPNPSGVDTSRPVEEPNTSNY